MIDDNSATKIETKSFGKRLQTAREALNLERKEVAAQLKLNEKIIIMLEKEKYAEDLPLAFIRGYLTAYARFLHLPESELQCALQPIKKAPQYQTSHLQPLLPEHNNYLMQFFSLIILLTILGLVATWWYTHTILGGENSLLYPLTSLVENQTSDAPVKQINIQTAVNQGLSEQFFTNLMEESTDTQKTILATTIKNSVNSALTSLDTRALHPVLHADNRHYHKQGFDLYNN